MINLTRFILISPFASILSKIREDANEINRGFVSRNCSPEMQPPVILH